MQCISCFNEALIPDFYTHYVVKNDLTACLVDKVFKCAVCNQYQATPEQINAIRINAAEASDFLDSINNKVDARKRKTL